MSLILPCRIGCSRLRRTSSGILPAQHFATRTKRFPIAGCIGDSVEVHACLSDSRKRSALTRSSPWICLSRWQFTG
jgi:hypothetical protein